MKCFLVVLSLMLMLVLLGCAMVCFHHTNDTTVLLGTLGGVALTAVALSMTS